MIYIFTQRGNSLPIIERFTGGEVKIPSFLLRKVGKTRKHKDSHDSAEMQSRREKSGGKWEMGEKLEKESGFRNGIYTKFPFPVNEIERFHSLTGPVNY